MATHTSTFFAVGAVGLLLGLTLLVLAKRVVRGRAERRSRQRRVAWVAALGTGAVADMRLKQLRALGREAARRAAAQEDLLALLDAGRLPPHDDRRQVFQSVLRRSGLQRALRSACRSRNAVARGRAALLWARLGLGGAERMIAPLMADADPDVRAAATQALACCGSDEAAWALLHALRNGHVAPERVVERLTGAWAATPRALHEPGFLPVRAWLAEALGLAGDARAEASLVEMVARGAEEERIRACRALGRLSRPTSFAALATALEDRSAAVRAQAARALADLGDPRSLMALAGLLDDDSWWVRARVADALRAIGRKGLAALAQAADEHPDPFARERAIEALSLEPEHALAALGPHGAVATAA
jgi:HEAT repeat protein